MAEPFNISYSSEPVLDGWGWADYWQCPDWVAWHKLNVQELGQEEANSKFIYWWDQQHIDANPYNWCKYNSSFYKYFKDQGIDTGWLLSKVFVGIDQLADGVPDLGAGLKKTLQWSKYILPIALIGFGLSFLYKRSK